MTIRRVLSVLLSSLVLAALGCGDDGDAAAPAGPPLGWWEREITEQDVARGVPGIPTGTWRMQVREDRIIYSAPDEGSVWQLVEHGDGAFEMGEFAQGSQSEFCPPEDAPGFRYPWRREGDELLVELDGEDPCIDRDVIVPGTWRAAEAPG